MSNKKLVPPEKTVLIFQGGGALGAYQAGVYEALHRATMEPHWVIGTSIGAINASLIVGNPPGKRLQALNAFWQRMGQSYAWDNSSSFWQLHFANAWMLQWNYFNTLMMGLPGFFLPRPTLEFALGYRVAPEQASFYDTGPLRQTLEALVDFDCLNNSPIRLSVGATDIESGVIRYFDSAQEKITVEHVMASGALPPAFPPVSIDGRLYWDGGIHSNTPLEWMLQDHPRYHTICFLANLWPIYDNAPTSQHAVLRRAKELQYASRTGTLINIESELHSLRHGIEILAAKLQPGAKDDEDVIKAMEMGCESVFHLVQLQLPRLDHESQGKDVEFARERSEQRWIAGYVDTKRAIDAAPWNEHLVGADEGVVVHDFTNSTEDGESRQQLWHRQPTADGIHCIYRSDPQP